METSSSPPACLSVYKCVCSQPVYVLIWLFVFYVCISLPEIYLAAGNTQKKITKTTINSTMILVIITVMIMIHIKNCH